MRLKGRITALAIGALLVIVALLATGCEDFTQFPAPQPTESPPTKSPARVVTTADRATLVVYEHLLSLAQSAEAKQYLAEFYAIDGDWKAEQELFKDGTSLWYVTVDMATVQNAGVKTHWRQAGWFVHADGKVVPSNRLEANALLIEADLQKLSASQKS